MKTSMHMLSIYRIINENFFTFSEKKKKMNRMNEPNDR